MRAISGIAVPFDPSMINKVADLIYFDGPLLSHYYSDKGDDYLFYWVDSDSDYNRWLLIRTDLNTIQSYLDKRITLYSIVTNPNDGFLRILDIDANAKITSVRLVLPAALPEDYLPSEDSYYDYQIVDSADVSSLSKRFNSGVFDLHITGKDVRYGAMPLDKYSGVVSSIKTMSEILSECWINEIKEQYKKERKKMSSFVESELRLHSSYEFIYSLAGSVRIILKPVSDQLAFSECESDSFAKVFINVLNSGFDKSQIEEYASRYGTRIYRKYNEFLTFLDDNSLAIGLNWNNALSSVNYSYSINETNRSTVRRNLSEAYYEAETIQIEGRFYSLNTKSGVYSFESTGKKKEHSRGRFSNSLLALANSVSFGKDYSITIERCTRTSAGLKDNNDDLLVSFNEIKAYNQ